MFRKALFLLTFWSVATGMTLATFTENLVAQTTNKSAYKHTDPFTKPKNDAKKPPAKKTGAPATRRSEPFDPYCDDGMRWYEAPGETRGYEKDYC